MKKTQEENREPNETGAYLVPPGSLAGRLAIAATAEGGQRKQQRRRRWLGGLLRSPYWRGPFLSPCGPHCRRVGRPPVLSRSVREDAAHRRSVVTLASSCLPLCFASRRRLARHGSRRRAATDSHRRIPPPSSSALPPPPSSAATTFPARLCSSLSLQTTALIYF